MMVERSGNPDKHKIVVIVVVSQIILFNNKSSLNVIIIDLNVMFEHQTLHQIFNEIYANKTRISASL